MKKNRAWCGCSLLSSQLHKRQTSGGLQLEARLGKKLSRPISTSKLGVMVHPVTPATWEA
jgi:hypothetical protein